ncbi:transposase [Thiorhodovibrio frisius]|uniref:Transposase domain (DUF772) n=1 Tax=Thiorhodovibrio frisius TaxID=631362 RepID=H8YX31_9GAMM|nr:transposase [Thiorhodovibrio frisius]EIC23007.1 Transposase domain (DUF772) [Thiorhodovibrio frisius]WPL22727.1 hypothetical protein Thiofri_02897 [Thiorhodovibrio frisius]
MAAMVQANLFSWDAVEARSDLSRLTLAIDHLPDERLVQYLEVMRGHGRDDYPARAMWNSLLAGIVFQHQSPESLLRELARNPSLMDACGQRFAFETGVGHTAGCTRTSSSRLSMRSCAGTTITTVSAAR